MRISFNEMVDLAMGLASRQKAPDVPCDASEVRVWADDRPAVGFRSKCRHGTVSQGRTHENAIAAGVEACEMVIRYILANKAEADAIDDPLCGPSPKPPEPLPPEVVAGLDPGVRDLVVWMNSLGIPTGDSGDGVSKPAGDRTFDVPHVCAVYFEEDAPMARIHALRLCSLLPDREGASVEVSWNARDLSAVLLVTGYTNADVPR